MICADFLAGANLENENPEVLHATILYIAVERLDGAVRELFQNCVLHPFDNP
jgi:hypothetical protein